MRSTLVLALASVQVAVAQTSTAKIFTDLSIISRLWGEVSVYEDNAEDYFGVNYVGLPDGCQVEQVHTLQRHAQRFPTGSPEDATLTEPFAARVAAYLAANPTAQFTGSLTFLNTYKYVLSRSYLTNIGATTEFQAGATFWNRYGRILYNATLGQLSYNTAAGYAKPVLRTTDQSRIWNSALNWALGFFGTSFQATPNPTIAGFADAFDLVIIPEGGTENNTLASYDSCFNDYSDTVGYLGDNILFTYLPRYLADATTRLNTYAPSGFSFTYNDTYAMQDLCAYESEYLGLGASPFCNLFTQDEWKGYEQAHSIEYYYDYSFGNPTGRAQGIGYVQELLARLQNQYITSSNSSVNSSYDSNAGTFPLHQPFYLDFSHDDIIISALTAMSMEYFHQPPDLTTVPPKFTNFRLGKLTPFGGRLTTEVIGCAAANPDSVEESRFSYYPEQYGYSKSNAPYKFIRMRLNHGILPLKTITGKSCKNGRNDGMCALSDFVASQSQSYALSNYNYACFGNWTINNTLSGIDYDGAIFAGKVYT